MIRADAKALNTGDQQIYRKGGDPPRDEPPVDHRAHAEAEGGAEANRSYVEDHIGNPRRF